MYVPEGPLDADDIDHFRRFGFVKVARCFDAGPGTLAARWRDEAWERLGYAPDDQSTWREVKIHMPSDHFVTVSAFAPKAMAAMGQLCGGSERLRADTQWSDAFILNLSFGADEDYVPPSAAAPGWHKDGDFFVHFLDSPEQALLVVVLWDDVVERAGGTYIACDSVGHVARYYAAHPEGIVPMDPKRRDELGLHAYGCSRTSRLIGQCTDFREVVGRGGDVFLLHPYMLHTSSQNMKRIPRFMTNPLVSFVEPMCFNRPDGRHSVVEQCVLDAVNDGQPFDFVRTGEARVLVPDRLKDWERRRQEEAARRRA